MVDANFEFCEFVEWNMCYVTYNDFCNKCIDIKSMYKDLTFYEKRFYKWYVYANVNMNETHKNAIWEYLNFDDTEYYLNLLHLQTISKKKF